MTRRIIAISIIFICSWIAWAVLTLVVHVRTDEKGEAMAGEVGQLWGTEHSQTAPEIAAIWTTVNKKAVRRTQNGWEYMVEESADGASKEISPDSPDMPTSVQTAGAPACEVKTETVSTVIEHIQHKDASSASKDKQARSKTNKKKAAREKAERAVEVTELRHMCNLPVSATQADVDLDIEYRKKGLLWFSLYDVDFRAAYKVSNPTDQKVRITVSFGFPSSSAIYDDMHVTAPGRTDLQVATEGGKMIGRFSLPPHAEQKIGFAYRSRGMDRWSYRFGQDVKIVRNFRLNMHADFDEIDFPVGSISPDKKQKNDQGPGWTLIWDKESLVSGLEIGILMPHRINPGPLAAAMCLHAPVSLFFFFFVIFILQILRGIRIHPMNYFFIAASFFAFNLLFSYLVDHIDIALAFTIASLVSTGLVISYLRLVVSSRFALVEAGISQLVYQVLFSLAHFLEGYTGLTVTVGAIVTLAITMRLTARLDWEEVFKNKTPSKNRDSVLATEGAASAT